MRRVLAGRGWAARARRPAPSRARKAFRAPPAHAGAQCGRTVQQWLVPRRALVERGGMSSIEPAALAELLRHLPEWIRNDLAAKDASLRTRAEEALAAMISAELKAAPAPPRD
jgi:hypothetical protein